jgi:hypothetical protein
MRPLNITTTPELVEAIARLELRGAKAVDTRALQDELADIYAGNSVCAGLTDVREKHRAVARAYPQMYAKRAA